MSPIHKARENDNLAIATPYVVGRNIWLKVTPPAWAKLGLVSVLVLLTRNTVLIRQRSTESFATIDAFAAIDLFAVAVGCVIVAFSFLRIPTFKKAVKQKSIYLLVLFYGFCALSSLWSANTLYSAFRAIQPISQVLVVFLFLHYAVTFRRAELWMLKFGMVVIILGILGTLRLSGFTISTSTLHTNSYTASAGMLMCYCLGEWFGAKAGRARVLALTGTLACLAWVAGNSVGSLIAGMFGIFTACIFALSAKRTIPTLILLLSAFPSGIIALGSDTRQAIVYHLLKGRSLEMLTGMTGRVNLWERTFETGMERPFMGHGFAIATRIAELPFNSAHNVLLEIFVSVGVFGVIFFLLWVFLFAKDLIGKASKHRPGSVGCLAAMAAGAINNQSAPFLGGAYTAALMVFAAMYALHTFFVLPNGQTSVRNSILLGWRDFRRELNVQKGTMN